MIKKFETYIKESHFEVDPYSEEDWDDYDIEMYHKVVEKEMGLYPSNIKNIVQSKAFNFDYIDEKGWKLKTFWLVCKDGEFTLRSIGPPPNILKLIKPDKEIIIDAIERMMHIKESSRFDIDPYGEEEWGDQDGPIYVYKKLAETFSDDGRISDATYYDEDEMLGYFNFIMFRMKFHLGTFGGGELIIWKDSKFNMPEHPPKKKNKWVTEKLENERGLEKSKYEYSFLNAVKLLSMKKIEETTHYDIDPLGEEEWNDDIDISNNKLFQAMLDTASWETNHNLIDYEDHKYLTFLECAEKAAKKVYYEVYGDDENKNKDFIIKALMMAGKWRLFVPSMVAKTMSFAGARDHLIFRMMNKIKKIKLNESH
jgi:hypothetical protein